MTANSGIIHITELYGQNSFLSVNISTMKIVLLDSYTLNPGDLSWDNIKALGDCHIYERTAPEDVIERCKDAEAVFTNKVIFTKEVIAQLPQLKYIGVIATGYNVIDLAYAKERNIVVTNIPAYSTASVAQMVFSQILNFAQNISTHATSVANGDWGKSIDFSYRLTPQIELAGKTLGIIGFGKIGQAVAQLGIAFGMKIIYQNRSIKDTGMPAEQVDLPSILAQSDFLSINCPLTDENQGFMNAETLKQMKPSAFLINTGRGPLINESDLATALNDGIIAGAGLDVLSIEPASQNNPLATAKNCYITPHIAWATHEARTRCLLIAINNLKAFINGKPINVVNP